MVKSNVIPQLLSTNAPAWTNDIRAIRAPVPVPNVWAWAGVLLALVILGLLAWWFWRRRAKPAQTPEPGPVVPPHEKAREKLREALTLLDQPRPFCILVSDTIRLYLEERFQLRAPERTTEEFLEELQHSPLLAFDQKRALGEFLMSCDLVKFARHEPARTELQGIYEAAVRLIDETQPPPALPAETPAAAASESR